MAVVVIVKPNVRDDSGQVPYWVAQKLAELIEERFADEIESVRVSTEER